MGTHYIESAQYVAIGRYEVLLFQPRQSKGAEGESLTQDRTALAQGAGKGSETPHLLTSLPRPVSYDK